MKMHVKKTIWSVDLDQFEGEDDNRWCYGGGGKSPPPPPPPEPKDDRRPDDSKSKGIEETARARDKQSKKGSRGGLKIASSVAGTGVSTAGEQMRKS